MSFFGTSRRVARRTSRRTVRRWGAQNQTAPAPYEEVSPQQSGGYTQAQHAEDPIKLLQMRLAKGEITPEQYQASLKMLLGA